MTDQTVDLLARLVSIDSANSSMGGPGEADLAAEIASFGHSHGLVVATDEVLPDRSNVSLTLPGTTGTHAGRRLLFDLHLDTVPHIGIPNATVPRIDGDRMWGRGTCDTKGALAAALVAVGRLAREVAERDGEVMLLFTVDEEYLKRGVAHAVASDRCAQGGSTLPDRYTRSCRAHVKAREW